MGSLLIVFPLTHTKLERWSVSLRCGIHNPPPSALLRRPLPQHCLLLVGKVAAATHTKQMAESDPALAAFDGLRVREVSAGFEGLDSFRSKFQSTAADLEPDERIKLNITYVHKTTEFLKAVLADPQASKVCALRWWYHGDEDVNSIVSLLTNNCPELASLEVDSELDFVSTVLEHPRNKIKVLELLQYKEENLRRFFAALGQSQVSALAISGDGSPEFYQGLYEYLEKDLLVRLKVSDQVQTEMMMLLADCTRFAELEIQRCNFSQPILFANLPKCIAKLALYGCIFDPGFDWSFLADSNVQELDFSFLHDVDGSQFAGALAVYLRAKGRDKVRFFNCVFTNETLAAVGGEIGRIKRLDLDGSLNEASIALIAFVLRSPNSEIKELTLNYDWRTRSSIENHLVPALKHTNCNLTKLIFWTNRIEYKAAAKAGESKFRNRLALFVLLQGQQVRRKVPCLLRRLPVEMFRMVGMVLL